MERKLILIILFYLSHIIYAQTPDENLNTKFDSIFLETATRITHQDVARSIHIADSLYEHSVHEEHKMRALMLSANSHQSLGNVEEAIKKAMQAEEMAIKLNNYQWHARILGFLSTEFRNIGMLQERKNVLNTLEKTIAKVSDSIQQNVLYSMYYQERAFNLMGEFDEEQVWEYMNLSEQHLSELPDTPNKTLLKGINEWINANVYIEFNKNPDSALIHLDRAIELFEESNSPQYLTDIILMNKGRAHIMKNEMEEGFKFLKESEKLTENSENIYVKLKIYEELQKYYRQVQDTSNLYLYLEKQSQLQDFLNKQKIQPVLSQMEILRGEKDALTQVNKRFRSAVLALFIVLILGIILYEYRKRRTHKKFQNIIAELKEEKSKTRTPKENIVKKPSIIQASKSTHNINEETYKKILSDLKKFEASHGYLKANLTLADLASEISVNTKYLSLVLNQEIGKDFNKYINEARINYIIDRLHNVEEYRLYKLSFLAEECGFSSHSKFSAVFKSVTGLTPSAFIKLLNQEDEKIKVEQSEMKDA